MADPLTDDTKTTNSLPPGVKFDPVASPPPGVKFDKSAEVSVPAQEVTPKTTKPATPPRKSLAAMMAPTAENKKKQREFNTGFDSGVAQSVLGTGQALTSLGGYVAPETAKKLSSMETDWQNYLKTIGDPKAQAIGELAGGVGQFALGGEVLAGAKGLMFGSEALAGGAETLAGGAEALAGGKKAAAAAEAGAAATEGAAASKNLTKAQATLRSLKAITSSTTKGAKFGAFAGATAPRTETLEKQASARWDEIRTYAAKGALTGAILGTVPEAAKFLNYSWKELSPKSRQTAVDYVTKLMQNMQADASKAIGGAAELEETRLKAAKAAQQQGFTEEEAANFANVASQQVIDAHQFAEQIAADFEKLGKEGQSATSFGEFSKKWLEKNQKAIENARDERVGVKAALDSAPEGAVVDLQGVKDYIDKALPAFSDVKGVPNTSTGRMLMAIKRQLGLLDEEVVTSEEGAQSLLDSKAAAEAGEEGNKISLKNANELRIEFNDMLRTKKLASNYGITQPSDVQLKQIEKIVEALNDSAGEAHPPYMDAVRNFRAESRALDPYVSGGFQGLTDTNVVTGAVEQMDGQIARALLKMARAGNKDLADAINKDPEFKEQAKKYFTGELFGVGEAAKPITDAKLTSFWKNNEELLDQTGLKDYFMDIQKKYRSGQEGVEKAQGTLEAATDVQTKAKDLASHVAKVESAKKDLEILKQDVDKTIPENLNSDKLRSWVNKMDDTVIDVEKRGQLLDEINEIDREYNATKDAQARAKSIRYLLLRVGLGFAGVGALATGSYPYLMGKGTH